MSHQGPSEAHDAEAIHEPRTTSLDGADEPSRARSWRWGLRLGGGVALLTLLAVAAVALLPLIPRPAPPRALPPPPPKIITLQLPDAARGCVGGAAWSPDGARVALVRDSLCDASATTDPNDPTALIFDATTGKLENSFPLDRMIAPADAPPGSDVALGAVIWASSGDQIAVFYVILEPDAAGNKRPSAEGVALLTVSGTSAGRFASEQDAPLSSAFVDPLTLSGPQTVEVWGVPTSPQSGLAGRTLLTLPTAFAYRWGQDGALTPATLSGNHATDHATISLWDSGQLWEVAALSCANGQPAMLSQPYLSLTVSTAAWSPDGAHLVALAAIGRYPLPAGAATPEPATSTTCARGPQPVSPPLAPAPDAGLRAVLSLGASGQTAQISLAWRPDGARLAAFPLNLAGASGVILIYDCHTGALLRRYTASQFPLTGGPGTGPAKNFDTVFNGGVWSPDGRRLLVESSGQGALPFIVGPKGLGN